MMDVYCPRCAEPCDIDEFHYVDDMTFDQARTTFFDRSKGCGVLFGGKPCTPDNSLRAEASAALSDILGDDVDGIASMLDDFEYIGMLD